MAKIVEELVVIKVSKLVKGDVDESPMLSEEVCDAIETMVGEVLNDPKAIVEVVRE